jgi:hypothetical protein
MSKLYLKMSKNAPQKFDFKIRFNTLSKTENDRWRIIDPSGAEALVAHIEINAPCKTTLDYMKEQNEFKWHITATGVLSIIEDDTTGLVYAAITKTH